MADIALNTADRIEVIESQQQLTLVAGEAIEAGEIVRINSSGKWENADASGSGTADAYGMATKSVASGEPVTAIRRGVVDGFDLSGLAYGAKVYLSDTNDVGALADAAGSVSVICGRVLPANGQTIGNSPDKILQVEITA